MKKTLKLNIETAKKAYINIVAWSVEGVLYDRNLKVLSALHNEEIKPKLQEYGIIKKIIIISLIILGLSSCLSQPNPKQIVPYKVNQVEDRNDIITITITIDRTKK